jgi:hypothetical protein
MRVIGKTRRLNGLQGEATELEPIGKRRRFLVKWDNGKEQVLPKNSIKILDIQEYNNSSETQTQETTDNFVSMGSNVSDIDEETSESDSSMSSSDCENLRQTVLVDKL